MKKSEEIVSDLSSSYLSWTGRCQFLQRSKKTMGTSGSNSFEGITEAKKGCTGYHEPGSLKNIWDRQKWGMEYPNAGHCRKPNLMLGSTNIIAGVLKSFSCMQPPGPKNYHISRQVST